MKLPKSGPSSAPNILQPNDNSHNSSLEELDLCEEPEAKSAPLPRAKSVLPSRGLDLLSEEQLTKLTKSNTKKNLGGRKSRFRSQMERVCRRLDNLTVDVRLQHKLQMQALPVVQPKCESKPDRAAVVDALLIKHTGTASRLATAKIETATPKSLASSGKNGDKIEEENSTTNLTKLESDTGSEDDCFAIEPATQNDDLFGTGSMSGRSGVSSGAPKSVRISTSVTILDYESEDQPISVSTLQRLNHPTRKDRSMLNRRAIAQEVEFRNIRSAETARQDMAENDSGEDGLFKRRHHTSKHIVPSELNDSELEKTGKQSGKPTSRTTPIAAFACATPGGPYGPRTISK